MIKPPEIWKSLPRPHQRVLEIVFTIDQLKEANDRELGAQGCFSKSPASEWRWIWYWPVFRYQEQITLSPHFREARLSKQADAALEALEKSGLLESRVELVNSGSGKVRVWQYRLTRQGRSVARAGTGKERKKPLPPGTLREWHWKALRLAYMAGERGLDGSSGRYGGIPWNIWARLRNYKAGELVAERWGKPYAVVVNSHVETRLGGYRLCITPLGREYYEKNREQYDAMYQTGERRDGI